jgi:nucleoside-diphosphate-sugar epimerase
MTRFLVTGGTGFVGRYLVQKLLRNGSRIVLMTRDPHKAERWRSDRRVEIVPIVGGDMAAIPGRLDGSGQDIKGVFHLAANQKYLGPRQILYRDNVRLTEILLRWASERQQDFFVYTSSIDAMGPNPSFLDPATEESVCRPGSSYGWSKCQAEHIVSGFGVYLNTVSLRLSNVYGPGSGFIIIDIARALQEGADNPLFRYYHQIKDRLVHLCYVDDVVEGILQAAFSDCPSGEVFILAGDEPTSIATLFKSIAGSMQISFTPPSQRIWVETMLHMRQAYFIKIKKKVDRVTYFRLGNWFVSSDKARMQLRFNPRVALREGIQKTLAWGL